MRTPRLGHLDDGPKRQTGPMEGINSKSKVAKRMAYGYRDRDVFPPSTFAYSSLTRPSFDFRACRCECAWPGSGKNAILTLRIIRLKPFPLIGNDGISPPLLNLVQLIAHADVFRIMTGGRIPSRLRWVWIKLSVVATPNLLLHVKDQIF